MPQTYLNNFDNCSRKQPHVFALSLSDRRVFNAAVKDVAVEKDFYTLHKNNSQKSQEERLVWENHYARDIEPQLSALVLHLLKTCNSSLIQDNAIVLNKQQKDALSTQLLAQLLRGKTARSFTRDKFREQLPIVANIIKEIISPTDNAKLQLLEDFATNDDYFLETSMQAILYSFAEKKSHSIMRERIFVVYRASQGSQFVTSDHPVAFVDTATHNATPFTNGLAHPNTVVLFPLAPNLLLGVFHPEYRNSFFINRDCRLRIIEIGRQKEFAHYCNQVQMNQCNNFVFSKSRDSLSELKKGVNNKELTLPFNW